MTLQVAGRLPVCRGFVEPHMTSADIDPVDRLCQECADAWDLEASR